MDSPVSVAISDQRDELALAANCLEAGNRDEAISHLTVHVRQYPDQTMIRSMLAEQLVTSGRLDEARGHYLRLVDDWSVDLARHREQLVDCHTRLVQIAQDDRDEAAESYHRGMGLVLIAAEWDEDPDANRRLRERTLSQALLQFRMALIERPHDARLHLAMGDVLTRLGEHSAARSSYRQALAAPPGSLPAAERARIAENSQ